MHRMVMKSVNFCFRLYLSETFAYLHKISVNVAE